MSNLEELNYAIISDLRDQLEAKEQMIKNLKDWLKTAEDAIEKAYERKCENCYKGVCMYCSNADIVHYERKTRC